jgi:hypothetical protein
VDYKSTPYRFKMAVPSAVESIIADYAWVWRSDVRPNEVFADWRKGSPSAKLISRDPWWQHYKEASLVFDSWVEWCVDKMILGPPRPRGYREVTGYDEDYLMQRFVEGGATEFDRHYKPWMATWPEPEDRSWLKARGNRGVPEWAAEEYRRKVRKVPQHILDELAASEAAAYDSDGELIDPEFGTFW